MKSDEDFLRSIDATASLDGRADVSDPSNPRFDLGAQLDVMVEMLASFWDETDETETQTLGLSGNLRMLDQIMYMQLTRAEGSVIDEVKADFSPDREDDWQRQWDLEDIEYALSDYHHDHQMYPTELEAITAEGYLTEYNWDTDEYEAVDVPQDPDGNDYFYHVSADGACYLLGARLSADSAEKMQNDYGQDDNLYEIGFVSYDWDDDYNTITVVDEECLARFDTNATARPASAATDPFALMMNQWLSLDMSEYAEEIGLELAQSEIERQLTAIAEELDLQRVVYNAINNTAYFTPTKYLGMQDGKETFEITINPAALAAGIKDIAADTGFDAIPEFSEVVDEVSETMLMLDDELQFVGTIGFDPRAPEYFTLKADVWDQWSDREDGGYIMMDIMEDQKTIEMGSQDREEGLFITITHPAARTNSVVVEMLDDGKKMTMLEGTFAPNKLMFTAFDDYYNWETEEKVYQEVFDIDVNRDRNGIWSGMIHITHGASWEYFHIDLAAFQLDHDQIIFDATFTDNVDGPGMEMRVWLDLMITELNTVRIDIPRDVEDMMEFFEANGLD